MNNNSQELARLSKAGAIKAESSKARQEAEALFMPESNKGSGYINRDQLAEILETELAKLGLKPTVKTDQEQVLQFEERRMQLRERQASVNTTRAITGVMATWAAIGTAMLARSCINFDSSPKFKVNSK